MKRLAICCENDLLLTSHSPNIHTIVFKDVLWNGVTQSRHDVLESWCEVIKQNIRFLHFCNDWSLNRYTHWLDLYYMSASHTTCADKNNVTYVSMETKYPITKQRTFFKTRHSWPHIDLIKIETLKGHSSTSHDGYTDLAVLLFRKNWATKIILKTPIR